METDNTNEKTRKKPRKIIRRKSTRKEKSKNVEEVTEMVGGLKVMHPTANEIEETRSQPQSRRNSSVMLANEALTLPRRASNVALLSLGKEESESRENLRRGSVKRESVSYMEDEDGLEAKKIKATLEAMGLLKKKQREFTWDEKKVTKDKVLEKWKPATRARQRNVAMDKDVALRTLGLTNVVEGKVTKPKSISEYTEDEILGAFQSQCARYSKYPVLILINYYSFLHYDNYNYSAREGKFAELQDCHEAYQVLSKFIKERDTKTNICFIILFAFQPTSYFYFLI